MRVFSRALVGLYDLAEESSYDEFLIDALDMLQPWIKFDGAILWICEIDAGREKNLLIKHAHVDQKRSVAFAEQPQVFTVDSSVNAFLSSLGRPFQCDCSIVQERDQLHGLRDFVQKYELHRLMLFGESPSPSKPGRCLMLYRRMNTPFSALETDYLHTAWFHLMRALDINRQRVLERHDSGRGERASALANTHGFIAAADTNFHSLLRREWPNHQVKKLPQALADSVSRGVSLYRGRHIEVAIQRHSFYVTCSASEIDQLPCLTPREYTVARRFAAGLSYKVIARELGLSPHTVRNQIADLYYKLGVHDKTALAQYIATNAPARKEDDTQR
ncbi:MAG TPA: LuxR C-terminal-related transcriptional regulator [Burkholderiaceae bacterium]|nr:LuxR C-terminal-related transcriptional regulator [Burkholderiaceae bacterium]